MTPINKSALHSTYLVKIEEYLNNDNFELLDTFIEQLYIKLTEEERTLLSDIIDEATLYLELKESDYKEESLKLIKEFSK